MPRRQYRSPPVHEVILDLRFDGEVDSDALTEARGELASQFDDVSKATIFQLQTGMGSAGPTFQGGSEFVGWEFVQESPRWVLRAHSNQVTLHAVRSEKWPAGEYLGWERIHSRFSELLPMFEPAYRPLSLVRAGLRYINRVAIPVNSSLEEWFAVVPRGPELVNGLIGFGFQTTWAQVEGFPGLAANLRLGKTQVPEGTVTGKSVGILLDVDVFNLKKTDAPALVETKDWFHTAHAAENRLFEGCITDNLRERFDREAS